MQKNDLEEDDVVVVNVQLKMNQEAAKRLKVGSALWPLGGEVAAATIIDYSVVEKDKPLPMSQGDWERLQYYVYGYEK